MPYMNIEYVFPLTPTEKALAKYCIGQYYEYQDTLNFWGASVLSLKRKEILFIIDTVKKTGIKMFLN